MAAIFLIRNIPLMILFGNGKYIKNYCNVSKRMNRSKQGVEGVCFSAVECSPPPPPREGADLWKVQQNLANAWGMDTLGID